MWKDYSIGFIKRNRASSLSVLVAAFISALFLSLLCGLFYNFWNYEIESIVLEEGNWQARITGTFEEDAVSDMAEYMKTLFVSSFFAVDMMSMSASSIKRKSTLLLGEVAKRFIFRSATTFPGRKHLRENALLCFRFETLIRK